MMEIIKQVSLICLVLQLAAVDGQHEGKSTKKPMDGYGYTYGMLDECCPIKKIWDNPDPEMNGMFYLVGTGSVSPMCNSPCIYMKKDGDEDGKKYCFADSRSSQSECIDGDGSILGYKCELCLEGGDPDCPDCPIFFPPCPQCMLPCVTNYNEKECSSCLFDNDCEICAKWCAPMPGACFEKVVAKLAYFKQLWRDWVPYYEMLPVPDFPAMLSYENISLNSNDSINTDDAMGKPYVKWSKAISGELEEDPLYTIIQFDVSIQRNQTYIHWMKVNVNGTDSLGGEENMEYTPTFAFRSCNNGTTNHGGPCPRYIIDDPNYKHVFVTMVLRQSTGRIEVTDKEQQNGCNPNLLSPEIRFVNFDWMNNFINKYSLILEAGHFFQSPYTPIVDKLICLYVSCVPPPEGQPPFPGHVIDGVNDLPACEPFKGDPDAPVDYLSLKDN